MTMVVYRSNGMIADFNVWGIIPMLLDYEDPAPAREQFRQSYIGGWKPFEGFTFDPEARTLTYKGDPPFKALGEMQFREERILIFRSAWVMILQKDGSFEISRMD